MWYNTFLSQRKGNKMHRVFLFGSRDIYGIPDLVVQHLENILTQTNGEVEFIVGDAPGIDSAFHKALSSIGAASKTTVYCMEYTRNNSYDLATKVFSSTYDPDTKKVQINNGDEVIDTIDNIEKPDDLKYNRQFYEFKDRQMRNACTFAICIWDGKSKGTFTNINVLKAQDKYVYIYRVET